MSTLLLLVSLAVSATAAQSPLKAGADAPDFSAKGTDGKAHALKEYTEKGDVFLYFIGDSCPVNAQAAKYYNRLHSAYLGKAPILGVINTDAKGYKEWQEKFKPPFNSLYDPDLKIIRSYKANASPWVIQVSKAGKIAKVWSGYSAPALKEINAAMAKAAGAKLATVDLSGAPAEMAFG